MPFEVRHPAIHLFADFGVLAWRKSITAQVPDTFEVASLKPSQPGTRFSSKLDAAQFNCTAHSLLNLIQRAYSCIEVEPWRVTSGPGWLDTDRWDLAALVEEFKLKVHRETRDQAICPDRRQKRIKAQTLRRQPVRR